MITQRNLARDEVLRWQKRYRRLNDELSLSKAAHTELATRHQALEVQFARSDALLQRSEGELVDVREDLRRLAQVGTHAPALHDLLFKDDPFADMGKITDEDYVTPAPEEFPDVPAIEAAVANPAEAV